MILQELNNSSQTYTNSDDYCIFLRKWNPSKMTLDGFQEITITLSKHYKKYVQLKIITNI